MLQRAPIASPKGPALRLTEHFLERLGLTCILIDRLPGASTTRLLARRVAAMKARGTKVWFRTEREANAVLSQLFAANRDITKGRDGYGVAASVEAAVDLVRGTAFCAAITPIEDSDVTTTFASVCQRIDATLQRMAKDGTMKRIHAEYVQLTEAERERKSVNKATHAQVSAVYLELPPHIRERLKADFKVEKARNSKVSWNSFLVAKQSMILPVSPSKSGHPARGHQVDKGTNKDVSRESTTPLYGEWVVERLGRELENCTELVHITKL